MSGGDIRRVREARGMTQLRLAQILGVDQARVSHYERGTRTPDADMLRAIADALTVSMDVLWPTNLANPFLLMTG